MGDAGAKNGWVLLAETCSTNPLDIAPEMSLVDRIALVQRLGYPRAECDARGTQDLAASVLRQLAGLVEQSRDPVLIKRANDAIRHWNAQCIPFYEGREPNSTELAPQGSVQPVSAKETAPKGRRGRNTSD